MTNAPQMTFSDAVKNVFNNYANFNGRARRSEYWWYTLFTIICSIVLNIISPLLNNIFSLAIFIPSLAVLVRRLHDIGKSGWYVMLVYGPIILLFITGGSYLLDVLAQERNGVVSSDAFSDNPPIAFLVSGLLTLVGAIWLIVLCCTDSQPGDNAYGPNPKTGISEEDLDSIGNNPINNYN